MLTYQIIDYHSKMINYLEKIEDEIYLLIEYNHKYNELFKQISYDLLSNGSASKNSNDKYVYRGGTSNLLKSLEDILKTSKVEFNPLNTHLLIVNLKNEISEYLKTNNINFFDIIDMLSDGENAVQLFAKYLASDHTSDGVKFLEKTSEFIQNFYIIKNNISKNLQLFMPNSIELDNSTSLGTLELQLLNENYTFERFIYLLQCINKIYDELRIASSNKSEINDLAILKVESGSLFAKVFGDKNLLDLIDKYITNIVILIYKKFSKEGKIESLSKIRESLKEDIELAHELKELGYDITTANETIEKTFTIITQKSYELACSAPEIKINNQELKVENFYKDNFIEAAKTKLITDSNHE